MLPARIRSLGRLFGPVSDAPARQIIRRQFNRHPVTRKNPNIILPHFAGYMSKNNVIIVKFNPKHGVRERLDNCPFDFYCFFFCQLMPPENSYLMILYWRLITCSLQAVKSGGPRTGPRPTKPLAPQEWRPVDAQRFGNYALRVSGSSSFLTTLIRPAVCNGLVRYSSAPAARAFCLVNWEFSVVMTTIGRLL